MKAWKLLRSQGPGHRFRSYCCLIDGSSASLLSRVFRTETREMVPVCHGDVEARDISCMADRTVSGVWLVPARCPFSFCRGVGMQPASDSREGSLVRQEWGSNTEVTGWPEGQTGSWKPKPVPPVVGAVEFR